LKKTTEMEELKKALIEFILLVSFTTFCAYATLHLVYYLLTFLEN